MFSNTLIHVIIILSLLTIAVQDLIERKVYVWLFILSGLFLGIAHVRESFYHQFLITTIINCFIVLTILGILYLYASLILKKEFKHSFGLGDFIFFIILAIGFPTATFLVLFSFSLLFSLTIYIFLKSKLKTKSIPLAGLQALFISLVIGFNWAFSFSNLYTI